MHHAKKESKIEIAQKLLKRNRLIDEIVEDTDLTYEEIENIYSLYGKFQNSIKMLMQR